MNDTDKYIEFLKIRALCKTFARYFNALVPEQYALDFVTPILLIKSINSANMTSFEAWRAAGGNSRLWLEPKLGASWTRYTDNFANVYNEGNAAMSIVAQAFSHFTYEMSGGDLMVVSLQGADRLTWPVVHTRDGGRFCRDNRNLHTMGMDAFFSTHQCNDVCRFLHLAIRTDSQWEFTTPTSIFWSSPESRDVYCINPLCVRRFRPVPGRPSRFDVGLCSICESYILISIGGGQPMVAR